MKLDYFEMNPLQNSCCTPLHNFNFITVLSFTMISRVKLPIYTKITLCFQMHFYFTVRNSNW